MINFKNIKVGNLYNRKKLAETWGYNGHQGLSRGIVTPKGENIIVLFITKENQKQLGKYNNYFDVNNLLLFMDGESDHKNDMRLINSNINNEEVHLFYREKHHTEFEYKGCAYLASYEINENEPTRFLFSIESFIAEAVSNIIREESINCEPGKNFDENIKEIIDNNFKGDHEGAKKYSRHIRYERSIKNRAKAIEIHGTICAVCSFDFNKIYGADLAKDYIEIHHIKPLSENEGVVDPRTDLVPVCSNCHRMIHKSKNEIINIDELKNRVEKNKKFG